MCYGNTAELRCDTKTSLSIVEVVMMVVELWAESDGLALPGLLTGPDWVGFFNGAGGAGASRRIRRPLSLAT